MWTCDSKRGGEEGTFWSHMKAESSGFPAGCVYIERSTVYLERGAWVAQSAKQPTLGYGSGRDLLVLRWSLAWGSALRGESA